MCGLENHFQTWGIIRAEESLLEWEMLLEQWTGSRESWLLEQWAGWRESWLFHGSVANFYNLKTKKIPAERVVLTFILPQICDNIVSGEHCFTEQLGDLRSQNLGHFVLDPKEFRNSNTFQLYSYLMDFPFRHTWSYEINYRCNRKTNRRKGKEGLGRVMAVTQLPRAWEDRGVSSAAAERGHCG